MMAVLLMCSKSWSLNVAVRCDEESIQMTVSSPSCMYERYWTRSSVQRSSAAVLARLPRWGRKENCRVCLFLAALPFSVPLLYRTTSLRFSLGAAEQDGWQCALLRRGESLLASLALLSWVSGRLPVAMVPLLMWGVWLWVWRYSSSMSFPSFHRFHFFSISDCTWDDERKATGKQITEMNTKHDLKRFNNGVLPMTDCVRLCVFIGCLQSLVLMKGL